MNGTKGFLLARRALLAGGNRPDFPYKLTFVVTERCNLRCGFCRIWQSGREGLSLGEIRRFFTRSNRFSWIDVTGGEIFLRDDLPEIFSAILENCRDLALLHFPTNGYLVERIVRLTEDLVRGSPPRIVITVSVDGPPAVHDSLRGMPGSFERALETFVRLERIPGVHVRFGMTLDDASAGSIADTISAIRRWVPAFRVNDLHVNLPNRSDHYFRNAAYRGPSRGRLLSALRTLRRLRSIPRTPLELLEHRLLSQGERFLVEARCPVACQALAASCFLGCDGTVYPCVTWTRPLGTLRDHGFDLGAIWHAPASVEARSEVQTGGCPQCWTACEAVPSLAARCGGWLP